jgi:hypothetical protein
MIDSPNHNLVFVTWKLRIIEQEEFTRDQRNRE